MPNDFIYRLQSMILFNGISLQAKGASNELSSRQDLLVDNLFVIEAMASHRYDVCVHNTFDVSICFHPIASNFAGPVTPFV